MHSPDLSKEASDQDACPSHCVAVHGPQSKCVLYSHWGASMLLGCVETDVEIMLRGPSLEPRLVSLLVNKDVGTKPRRDWHYSIHSGSYELAHKAVTLRGVERRNSFLCPTMWPCST